MNKKIKETQKELNIIHGQRVDRMTALMHFGSKAKMKKYCCEPFEAHVEIKLFYKRTWEYKTPWCALVVESIPFDHESDEYNYMPIYKCPFCGRKIK